MVECEWIGKMTVNITWYNDVGKTKSGHKAGKGAVAVRSETGICKCPDWKLQPLKPKKDDCWNEFEIPGYGRGYARDTGGRVTRRDHIDIWLEDEKAWKAWVKDVKKNHGGQVAEIEEYPNKHHPDEGQEGCDPAKLKSKQMSVIRVDIDVYQCCEKGEKK